MAYGASATILVLFLLGLFGARVSGSLVLTQTGGEAAAQTRAAGFIVSGRKLLQGPELPVCPLGFTVCVFPGVINAALSIGVNIPVVRVCCPGSSNLQCPSNLQEATSSCVPPVTPPPVTPTPTPTVVCPTNFIPCIVPGQLQAALFPTTPLCCPGTTCPTTLNGELGCIKPQTPSPTPTPTSTPTVTPTPTPTSTPVATTPAGCPVGTLLCPVNAPQLGVTLFTCCKVVVCPSSNSLGFLQGPSCALPPLASPSP